LSFSDTLRVILSMTVFAGMIALCVLWRDHGGFVGLGGGALLFLWGYFQRSGEERLGNGYVGALMGLSLGFLVGAVGYYTAAHWQDWLAG
jgi:hypothetical protein